MKNNFFIKSFSQNLFRDIKYVYLLFDQIPKLWTLNIHKEYSLQFLLVKNFLDYLHIHLLFLIKDSMSKKIMYGILSDFIYSLSSNIVSNSTKIFIFTYVLMRFKFIFCSKGMKTIQAKKITMMFYVILLNNVDSFFTAR